MEAGVPARLDGRDARPPTPQSRNYRANSVYEVSAGFSSFAHQILSSA